MKNNSHQIKVFPQNKKTWLGKLYVSWVMLNLYPKRTILILAAFFVATVAEGLGLLSILPLIEVMNQTASGSDSRVAAAFMFVFNFLGIKLCLSTILTVLVLMIFFKAIITWAAMCYVGKVKADITSELRNALIRSSLSAKWSFFISRSVAKLVNAVSVESIGAINVYANSIRMIADLLKVLVLIWLAFYVDPRLVLVAVVVGGAMLFFLDYFLEISRRAGKRIVALMQSVTSVMADALQGIKPLKAMNSERCLLPVLSDGVKKIKHSMFKQVVAQETIRHAHEPVVVLIAAIVMYVAISFFSVPVAQLIVLIVLFSRIILGINTAQLCFQKVLASEHYYWSVADFINSASDEKEIYHGNVAPTLKNNIRLQNVFFSYGPKEVLTDISIDIPSFSFTALVGQSGSGKTTLVDLLCGLYPADSGDILLDGVSIHDVDMKKWRTCIGYVPQDLSYFHDSIMQNVGLGDPAITDESVERALSAAGAWEFVSELPDGVHTVIGERGVRLSGGQRQRISIARALVRKPKLLILDEATTALDKETEKGILGTLRDLTDEVTIIAVSHQSVLLDLADKIFRLHNGCITEVK